MISTGDIVYQDNRVRILHKSCKNGVIVGSHTCLQNVGFFQFQIPFYVRSINYETPVREIMSLYGFMWFFEKKRIYIRVDPEHTYIDNTTTTLSEYMKSRQSMSLIRQFLYNNSRDYYISVPVSNINECNSVRLL